MRIRFILLWFLLPGVAVLAAACGGTPSLKTSSGPASHMQPPGIACKGPPIRIAVDTFGDSGALNPGTGQAMAGMLADALSGSGCFVVVQAAAAANAKAAAAQLRIAGIISDFQSPCKGGSLIILPGNQACVTVDMQVLDAASGAVVHGTAAAGDSAVDRAGLIYVRGALPAALGEYAGTPMEQAIRNCTEHLASSLAYWYLTEHP